MQLHQVVKGCSFWRVPGCTAGGGGLSPRLAVNSSRKGWLSVEGISNHTGFWQLFRYLTRPSGRLGGGIQSLRCCRWRWP